MWSMVVVRDNSVEQIRYFRDILNAKTYTLNFIKKCDNTFSQDLKLEDGEYYYKNGLSIGLYQES